MKIATWNVNSVRVRLDQLIQWLHDSDIDVALLQEIKCINELFPTEPLNDAGYNVAVYGQRSYNGVAILSRYIIEDIVLWSDITDDDQARYIEAFINGMTIASVYVPNGVEPGAPQYTYKLNFLDILLDHIKNKTKFVIGGDFNITATDDDVYNPKAWKDKICCSKPERDNLQKFFDAGFADILRKFYPNDKIYTWWNYMAGGFAKNYGLRIDYMLATSDILINNASINKQVRANTRPSDHAPVEITVI